MAEPSERPKNSNFGSGPCAKRPGWNVEAVADAAVGRSHRSSVGKSKLKFCCTETKAMLGLPDDYLVGIVPASDTGAVEMVMWSMLGPRPVDICYFETFGKLWYDDAVDQLKLDNVREFAAPFGPGHPHLVPYSPSPVLPWQLRPLASPPPAPRRRPQARCRTSLAPTRRTTSFSR